jgi:hypothetical protein
LFKFLRGPLCIVGGANEILRDISMSDAHTFSSDVAFTAAVKGVQARKASREAYARAQTNGG